MDNAANTSQVVSRFLEHCEPFTALPLEFLVVDDDVYRCPTDSESVMAALSEKFGFDALVAAGVATTDGAGSPHLVTPLTGGRPIVVMRDWATGEPFDLLTDDGCVASKELPVVAALRDARTRELHGEEEGRLYAAFSLDDVLVLRASRMAATLAIGLDRLALNTLDDFEEVFCQYRGTGLSSPSAMGSPYENGDRFVPDEVADRDDETADTDDADEDRAEDSPTWQLVVLGWRPSEISAEPAAALPAVAERFQALARNMEFPADAVDLWHIKDGDLEKLRFIANERSAEHFAQALREASGMILHSIFGFSQERRRELGPPADYPEALQRLRKVIASEEASGFADRESHERARRDVERLFQQQVSGPMRSAAVACGDPVGRALLTAMAGLTDAFQRQSLIWEMPNRRSPMRDIDSSGAASEDTIKSLLRITDQMVQVSKAYVQFHPPQATMLRSNAPLLASPNAPRLSHSG